MVKKFIDRAFFFTILGIFAGAFYREFTKFLGFTGETTMSLMHTHLLTLGSLMLLVLGLLLKVFNVSENKKLINLFNLYTFSVFGNVAIMFVRGLYQVMGWEITSVINASISGIAGIIHILLTISLIWILNIIRKSITE